MNRLEVREQILTCDRCELHVNGPIPFSGPTPARYGVLAESPTTDSKKSGEPLYGPGRDVLETSFKNVGLDFNAAFVFNTVSCFSDGPPTSENIRFCYPNYKAQLTLSETPFVLVLGSVAASTLVEDVRITKAHGQVLKENGKVFLLTFHPAAAMRKHDWQVKMNQDIQTFSELIKTDPQTNDWHRFSPCKCIVCGISEEEMECEMFGDNGLPYCENHWS